VFEISSPSLPNPPTAINAGRKRIIASEDKGKISQKRDIEEATTTNLVAMAINGGKQNGDNVFLGEEQIKQKIDL